MVLSAINDKPLTMVPFVQLKKTWKPPMEDRVSHIGGGGGEEGGGPVPSPILHFFSNTPSIKTDAPPSPPKNEALPHLKTPHPHLKGETPFQEMIPRKKTNKMKTVINTCVSIYKTTLGKDGRNSTRMWFSHLEHSKFCKKSETVC